MGQNSTKNESIPSVTKNVPQHALLENNFESVDFYSHLVDTESFHNNLGVRNEKQLTTNEKQTWLYRFWKFITQEKIAVFIFLILLGAVSAIVALGTDYTISSLLTGIFISQIDLSIFFLTARELFAALSDNYLVSYILFILYSMFFVSLAATCVLYISPHSAGSGIPEMKSILSGIIMNRYLDFRTFVSKVLGLICSFAAGTTIVKK